MILKVKLVVRVIKNDDVLGGYTKDIELPFVPAVGMKFKHGISTRLWETVGNDELSPAVQKVIYDFDEECTVALFEVSDFLASSFWVKLEYEKLGNQCYEMTYFDQV